MDEIDELKSRIAALESKFRKHLGPSYGSSSLQIPHEGYPLLDEDSLIKDVYLPAGTALTREFYVPPNQINGAYAGVGNYATATANSSTPRVVYFTFKIPADFDSLSEAHIDIIPDATETIQYDLQVHKSLTGQQYNATEYSSLNQTKAVTLNLLTEIDITTVLNQSIATDQHVGIQFGADLDQIRILGLHVIYVSTQAFVV